MCAYLVSRKLTNKQKIALIEIVWFNYLKIACSTTVRRNDVCFLLCTCCGMSSAELLSQTLNRRAKRLVEIRLEKRTFALGVEVVRATPNDYAISAAFGYFAESVGEVPLCEIVHQYSATRVISISLALPAKDYSQSFGTTLLVYLHLLQSEPRSMRKRAHLTFVAGSHKFYTPGVMF